MNSLFEPTAYQEIVARLNQLQKDTPRLWGKMNAAQMLAHCNKAIEIPLSKEQQPRVFIGRIVGPLFRSLLYNDTPYKQSLRTAPNFVISEEKDFEIEKATILKQITTFHQLGEKGITKHPHPFFGKFTPAQWGMSQYKHLDHHLKQFGL
jgi:hypothetical protein